MIQEFYQQIIMLTFLSIQMHTIEMPLVLVDLGLVNFAENTDTKFLFTLERNINRLFESNKKVTSIPTEPDALIQFHDQPYISYEEINLTKTFDIYLSGILRSESALIMGVLPLPYQQLFEINKGTQSITVTFKGAQRQVQWLEISLIYDKSFQYLTTYDSYDLELATKLIEKIKFQNTTSTYILMGIIEYNQGNYEEKKKSLPNVCLSLIIVMDVVLRLLHNIKITQYIKK